MVLDQTFSKVFFGWNDLIHYPNFVWWETFVMQKFIVTQVYRGFLSVRYSDFIIAKVRLGIPFDIIEF